MNAKTIGRYHVILWERGERSRVRTFVRDSLREARATARRQFVACKRSYVVTVFDKLNDVLFERLDPQPHTILACQAPDHKPGR